MRYSTRRLDKPWGLRAKNAGSAVRLGPQMVGLARLAPPAPALPRLPAAGWLPAKGVDIDRGLKSGAGAGAGGAIFGPPSRPHPTPAPYKPGSPGQGQGLLITATSRLPRLSSGSLTQMAIK
jgi:hypothetical protein